MDNQSLNNNFSNRRTYAGLAIRFLARLTDWFILFTPQALFWWWSGRSIDSIASLTSNLILYITLFLVLGFVISLLYYSLSTTYWGATPGKLLVGLRVSGEDGQNLALGRSLFRHSVGYWVSALLWGLGYFWIVRDKNKQGWHDQISSSYVVHQGKSRWPLLLIILIALLSIDTVAAASGVQKIIANQELKAEIEDLGKVLEESFPSSGEERGAPSTPPQQEWERQVQELTNSAVSKFKTASQMSRDSEVSSKEQEEIARLLESAIADLKEAASLDSQNPDVWVNLGDLYASMVGSVEDADLWAVQSYQKALGLLPANHPSSSILERKISQLE